MSMEFGGVPSGAQNMSELFETEYDEKMAESWSQDIQAEIIVPEAVVEARCECCNLVVCDPLYRYI